MSPPGIAGHKTFLAREKLKIFDNSLGLEPRTLEKIFYGIIFLKLL